MNRIKYLRMEHDMKQSDLARRLNVRQNTISNWENGRTEPDSASIQELANIFDVTTDFLLGYSSNKSNPHKNPLTEQWQGDLMKTLETIGALEPTGGLNEKGREVITEFLRSNAAVLKKLINEGE